MLRDVDRLSGIPSVLIHGRLDLSSPLGTAWDQSLAWRVAKLVVVHDSGHTGNDTMLEHIRGTLEDSPTR